MHSFHEYATCHNWDCSSYLLSIAGLSHPVTPQQVMVQQAAPQCHGKSVAAVADIPGSTWLCRSGCMHCMLVIGAMAALSVESAHPVVKRPLCMQSPHGHVQVFNNSINVPLE